MHARTIDSIYRFGHKGCMQTMTLGNGLYSQLEGHDIICRCQSLVILKINLVL